MHSSTIYHTFRLSPCSNGTEHYHFCLFQYSSMRLQSYIAAGIGDYVIMLVGEALLGGTTLVREYKL